MGSPEINLRFKIKAKRLNERKTNLFQTFERHTLKLFFYIISVQIEALIITGHKLINSIYIQLALNLTTHFGSQPKRK